MVHAAWNHGYDTIQDAVLNGAQKLSQMSAALRTAVHDGLLHPHRRHCSSPASAVRRLPSAVRTATPAAWNSLPGYLRDPSRSFDSFRRDLKTFLFSFY